MSKKQKIIMLGASSSGFNGVVTGSVVITPTPMSSQTINITKSFNELDISGPTTLLYSGTPGVDGLRTIVGLQNTTASPVVVTLPGSPQAWSIDHGSVQGSFTIPAYGRIEMLFRWDATDGIWVVSSMPMTIAQVKAILAILFSDIGGIIGPNQLGSGSALQVVRRNAANDALEFADGGTGSGDVTAASSFGADNRIVRSDGTGKGVQASGAEIDDNGNVNVLGDGVQGSVTLADAHATDPKSISITVPATITNPYRLVLPGVIPTVDQGLRVASIAGDVVTLEHATPVVLPALSALTFASTLDLAFTDAFQRRSLAMTGNLTLTGSGYADKRKLQVFVAGDTVSRTLAFPSGWVFVGAKPTELAANKNAVFSLECTSGSESGVRCAWGVQP